MKTNLIVFIICLAMPLLLTGKASAIVISGIDSSPAYFGDTLFIYDTPPSSMENNGTRNVAPEAFNEQQSITLLSNLAVDGGFISSGIQINSQMIFLNVPENYTINFANALWTFENEILGVISSTTGLFDSDFLGASATAYPSTFLPDRGLEIGTTGFYSSTPEGYLLTASNQLTVNMSVERDNYGYSGGNFGTDPGDWLRVITASSVPTSVPTPATLFLLLFGLVSMLFLPANKLRGVQ